MFVWLKPQVPTAEYKQRFAALVTSALGWSELLIKWARQAVSFILICFWNSQECASAVPAQQGGEEMSHWPQNKLNHGPMRGTSARGRHWFIQWKLYRQITWPPPLGLEELVESDWGEGAGRRGGDGGSERRTTTVVESRAVWVVGALPPCRQAD
jgi:hypothetical protein